MSNDLLSQLQAAKTDEEREWIVLEFSLQNLDQEIQDAIWAAAIPHWFDVNFLVALLEKPIGRVETIYKRLQELSFVEVFPSRGYNIHERTRKLLLKHLWETDTEKFRELSRRAAEYSELQDQKDVGWRVEWVYHELIADSENGSVKLQTVGWNWNNAFAYDKVDTMVRVIREHAEAGRLAGRGLGWVQFWDAMVDRDLFRNQSSKKKLLEIDLERSKDKHLTAETKSRLGTLYLLFSEYEESQKCFIESLAVCRETKYRQGEANCLKNLGDVYERQSEFDKARVQYEKAIPIYKEIGDKLGEANCIYNLGSIHRAQSEFDQARSLYDEAMGKYKAIDFRLGEINCISMIGFILNQTGEYASARSYFYNARVLYESIGDNLGIANTYLYLGDSDFDEGKWSDAEEKYQKALVDYQQLNMPFEIALAYQRLGDTAKGKSDINLARQHYNNALDIFVKIGSSKADNVRVSLESLPK